MPRTSRGVGEVVFDAHSCAARTWKWRYTLTVRVSCGRHSMRDPQSDELFLETAINHGYDFEASTRFQDSSIAVMCVGTSVGWNCRTKVPSDLHLEVLYAVEQIDLHITSSLSNDQEQ